MNRHGKRYGIIVMDKKTGERISGVEVELTDFSIHRDDSPIYDSDVTNEFGLVYLDPPKKTRGN